MKKALLPVFSLLISTLSYGQWSDIYSPSMSFGRSVKILNSTTAVIAGSYSPSLIGNNTGKLFRTINGGASITEVFSGGNEFYDFYFWNATEGIAVGSTKDFAMILARTVNGGQNWTSQIVTDVTVNGNTIVFLNQNTGFVGADNGIFKTIDAGITWKETKGTNNKVNAISFPSSLIGFASTTTKTVYKTIDGGDNWIDISKNLNYDYSYSSIYFIDNLTGFAIPWGGNTLFKTINGGDNWKKVTVPDAGNLYELKFLSPTLGFAVGETGDGAYLAKTTDAGETWTTIHSPYTVFSYYSFDISGSFLLAAGMSGYSKTNTFISGLSIDDNNYYSNRVKIQNPSERSFIISTEDQVKKVVLINQLGQREVFDSKSVNTSFSGIVVVNIELENFQVTRKLLIK